MLQEKRRGCGTQHLSWVLLVGGSPPNLTTSLSTKFRGATPHPLTLCACKSLEMPQHWLCLRPAQLLPFGSGLQRQRGLGIGEEERSRAWLSGGWGCGGEPPLGWGKGVQLLHFTCSLTLLKVRLSQAGPQRGPPELAAETPLPTQAAKSRGQVGWNKRSPEREPSWLQPFLGCIS